MGHKVDDLGSATNNFIKLVIGDRVQANLSVGIRIVIIQPGSKLALSFSLVKTRHANRKGLLILHIAIQHATHYAQLNVLHRKTRHQGKSVGHTGYLIREDIFRQACILVQTVAILIAGNDFKNNILSDSVGNRIAHLRQDGYLGVLLNKFQFSQLYGVRLTQIERWGRKLLLVNHLWRAINNDNRGLCRW